MSGHGQVPPDSGADLAFQSRWVPLGHFHAHGDPGLVAVTDLNPGPITHHARPALDPGICNCLTDLAFHSGCQVDLGISRHALGQFPRGGAVIGIFAQSRYEALPVRRHAHTIRPHVGNASDSYPELVALDVAISDLNALGIPYHDHRVAVWAGGDGARFATGAAARLPEPDVRGIMAPAIIRPGSVLPEQPFRELVTRLERCLRQFYLVHRMLIVVAADLHAAAVLDYDYLPDRIPLWLRSHPDGVSRLRRALRRL